MSACWEFREFCEWCRFSKVSHCKVLKFDLTTTKYLYSMKPPCREVFKVERITTWKVYISWNCRCKNSWGKNFAKILWYNNWYSLPRKHIIHRWLEHWRLVSFGTCAGGDSFYLTTWIQWSILQYIHFLTDIWHTQYFT